MKRPFMLYHWSPRSRRESILRHGLKPRSLSHDTSWRPPYTCFSLSPNTAWALSATHTSKRQQWDLWAVWSDWAGLYRTVNNTRDPRKFWYMTEYRTLERIPTSKVIYIATRLRDTKKRWRP